MALSRDTSITADGGLHQLGSGGYINWRPDSTTITLDGDFSTADLQWLIDHVRANSITDDEVDEIQ